MTADYSFLSKQLHGLLSFFDLEPAFFLFYSHTILIKILEWGFFSPEGSILAGFVVFSLLLSYSSEVHHW